MSNASQGIAWAHTQAPTKAAKLILLKIADMDGDGGAWPSMDTLADAGMCSREGARQLVRQLEALGEIRTHLNEGGGLRTQKHMRTNRYEFLLRCPWHCDGTASHRDLRDDKNANWRPPTWEKIVALNEPQNVPEEHLTPPSQLGPLPARAPKPARGAPPSQLGTNHHLTTPSEQDLEPVTVVSADARETDDEDQPKDDYSNFGNILYDSRRKYEAAMEAKRRRPAPAPRALPRTDAEQARAEQLQTEPCPAQPEFTHWIPISQTMCVRGCGTTITTEQETAA
ncbi:MAG: helix-turn-helix domain-containing protein [Candidatus Leucobacter sulfamidivorax]|nr:helix-turn-helix domain-containing protein [Candidatus Leucobacter sulfamidivorax]